MNRIRPGAMHCACKEPYKLAKAEEIELGDYLRGQVGDYFVENVEKPQKTSPLSSQKVIFTLVEPTTRAKRTETFPSFQVLCMKKA